MERDQASARHRLRAATDFGWTSSQEHLAPSVRSPVSGLCWLGPGGGGPLSVAGVGVGPGRPGPGLCASVSLYIHIAETSAAALTGVAVGRGA